MNTQKRLASKILKASHKRIKFDNQRLADIKDAITKTDVRLLVNEGAITKVQKRGVSRARARNIQKQKSKGRRKGPGSRKGTNTSRLPRKESWMNRIRSQRTFIAELKEKQIITNKTYRELYRKSKGGFFRSTRHVKVYLEDNKLFLIAQKAEETPSKQKKQK
ncbi:MAG: 50S ribosomal protein L19e [Candidatus Woesearchaeota archaeon]|jgi:large subunit ribosomal protein L19e